MLTCQRPLKDQAASLNQREREFLARVMNDRLNKSMARHMDETQRTMKNIRVWITNKLKIVSVVELAGHLTELQLLQEIASSRYSQ